MTDAEFGDALYYAYKASQIVTRTEYVSTYPICEYICKIAQISTGTFEEMLIDFASWAISGKELYMIALEVDGDVAAFNRRKRKNQLWWGSTPILVILMKRRE